MRMLRMMMGITRKKRYRNDWVRESLGVADVGDKMAENRLRWYGHIMRMIEEDEMRVVRAMRVEEKARRDRPLLTWDEVARKDMKSRGLREEWVADREDWNLAIRIPTLVRAGVYVKMVMIMMMMIMMMMMKE